MCSSLNRAVGTGRIIHFLRLGAQASAPSRPITPVLARAVENPGSAVRVAAGEAWAFEALMRRHNRALFRTARAILRDDAEAEDALQGGNPRRLALSRMRRPKSRLHPRRDISGRLMTARATPRLPFSLGG
jgi:hypothetical protein